jgi:hypothetical protein
MSERDEADLPPAERERLRHRDRKRQTRMVVDNAGVKRVLRAVAEKHVQQRNRTTDEPAKGN